MSTLSDFFGGNNKIGVNGTGKQVYYAMVSYNTGQGAGGFAFYDEEFRLISSPQRPGDASYGQASGGANPIIYLSGDSAVNYQNIFNGATSTSNRPSSSATSAYLNAVNASGEFGNARVSVYSDGTYEQAGHMSGSSDNKHYLNAYAIDSDHLNKRNAYILTGGLIRCIDRLNANYNYAKPGTTDYTVTSLNTTMQGSASYNRVRKEMVILSYASSGGNFNVITFTNLDFDLYESPAAAFAAATRVNSTVAFSTSWSENGNEPSYNLKPVLCDSGLIYVSVMFASTAQRLYSFTRSGTSSVTGTLVDSNTITTAYGFGEGFQYGQRSIDSRDATTVAIFCPYYYYGSGCATFFINRITANYTKYLNTNTSDGVQVLPYRDNGWVLFFAGNGYAGNFSGNYIVATYLPSTSATAGSGFTQVGTTKYLPGHPYPNTTNYPGMTQVVDYDLLVRNNRLYK
jgi:hypothetical protein